VDDQPPRFPQQLGEEAGDEAFPRFDPGFSADPTPRPVRARGAQPYRGGGQPNPWLVGLAVAAVLIAVSVIAFGLFAPDDDTDAAATTTPTETTADTGDGGTTDTTGDTGDGGTTDTTGDTSDDGSTATTVTLPDTTTAEVVPVGDPIPIAELTMSSNDVGPLDFGDPADEVLGRFAATFGVPTQDTGFIVGNGSFGECAGDSIRVVQWGPLNIVIRGEPDSATFASYRMDLRYGGLTSPTRDMSTLSGLRVGDTVGQLETVYSGFVIEYVIDSNAGLTFELRSQRGGDLLLWGPVESQDAEALVTGIYSPDSCTT
jgi:hypothetical protein